MKQKYGLIGFPLEHSFSKDYFNKKFQSENIDAEYVNFPIQDVHELVHIIKENPTLAGLNVTLPYKMQVIPLLDELDPDAKLIGAVNVIKFGKGRFGKVKLKGYNSDIIGFKQSIKPMLDPAHKNALVLGTGGASRAVYQGLKQLELDVQYVSRFDKPDCITYEALTQDIIEYYTVIVNTTPLGMYPHEDQCARIPYQFLSDKHLLYDLLYNPADTLFMQNGRKYGATVKNGLEMLLLQAFAAWEIWTGNDGKN